jgi:hypothetical protein|tara:strand:+ start:56855 stop:56989 length:135 start_codon:yes stop_codon:yes gene_type:complete
MPIYQFGDTIIDVDLISHTAKRKNIATTNAVLMAFIENIMIRAV